MVSELISLPLRLSARAVRLSLHTAEEAVRLTVSVAEQVIQTVRPEEAGPLETVRPRPRDEPTATRPRDEPTGGTAPEPAADAREPAHVSAEPTLVEERAEPGAENGAGAEIHIDEPWPGYERMAATEIVDRLQAADPAELAAVELYERTHRTRQSVLTAAEDRLRTATGGGSQT